MDEKDICIIYYIHIIYYTHTYTHTHTEILLSHEKELNFAICSNMNWLGGRYAKWNKSERERILCDITYKWNLKKYNTLVNITLKKQTHWYREQTSG